MFELHFYAEPKFKICECCNNEHVGLTKVILRDGQAYGVYCLNFGVAHRPRIVEGFIIIGDVRDSADPNTRTSFSFLVYNVDNLPRIMFRDEDSLITALMGGTAVNKKEAPNHKFINDVMLIIHLAIEEEELLSDYLRELPLD